MRLIISLLLLAYFSQPVFSQTNWYIDNGNNNGDGSINDPFNSWSSAMKILTAGDTLNIMPGTYFLSSDDYMDGVNSGIGNKWITIRAFDPSDIPILKKTEKYRLVRLDGDSYYKFENIIFDGCFYGDNQIIIRNQSNNIEFSNCIIRNNNSDGVSINESDNVIFNYCEIYYCIRYESGEQIDAHGIMFRSGGKLTVNDSKIHHVTGDCIQTGTPQKPPVWDSVFVYRTEMFTGTVDTIVNGIPAGTYIGENAFDTKTINKEDRVGVLEDYRGYCYLENCIVHGFNRSVHHSAFNIKRTVDVILKNCVVYDCWIAYRFRGDDVEKGNEYLGCHGTLINCIGYNNKTTLWPERGIDKFNVYNCTFDKQEGYNYFEHRTDFDEAGWDMRNCIFYRDLESPAQLHSSNYAADISDFIDRDNHNYHLAANSGAIGTGVDIPEAAFDFENDPRIEGQYDKGAYIYIPSLKIGDLLKKNDFELFPNPTKGSFILRFFTESKRRIHVINSLGQVLMSFKTTAIQTELDLSKYPDGFYGIKIYNGGIICSDKILKKRI